MTGETSFWICGLLFAGLCVLIGITGTVSARQTSEIRLSQGILSQGILMTFVVGGTYFGRPSGISLGAFVVVLLLIIQTLNRRSVHENSAPTDENPLL